MQQKVLRPAHTPKFLEEELDELIVDYFRNEIFLPIAEPLIISSDSVLNASEDSLISAIRSGRIVFHHGVFRGKLNATLTKSLKSIGAKWDRHRAVFVLLRKDLPFAVKDAIDLSVARFEKTLYKIDAQIEKVLKEPKISTFNFFDRAIYHMEKSVDKTIGNMSIVAQYDKKVIAENYSKNLELDIKNWTNKNIFKLRKEVESSLVKGLRYEEIIESIEETYGVGLRKAKFLARQENNLLMSEIRQNRYQSYGSAAYYWNCVAGSASSPVRPMHKKLDRTIVYWESPPVVNDKGDRKHAGVDYGCRCYPRAVLQF